MLHLKRTTSENADFQRLAALLDQDLAARDGEDHAFYAQYNKSDNINNVVVIYQNEVAVGCGAFKEFDLDTVEIKRMFVLPDFRGKKIASTVLKELEIWATELNYPDCILETGKNNPNAVALYRKNGFEIMPNYGQYENIETSVCLKKHLKKSQN